MTRTSRRTEKEAAAILRRIVKVLPMPDHVAAYLRGRADALDPKGRPDS